MVAWDGLQGGVLTEPTHGERARGLGAGDAPELVGRAADEPSWPIYLYDFGSPQISKLLVKMSIKYEILNASKTLKYMF